MTNVLENGAEKKDSLLEARLVFAKIVYICVTMKLGFITEDGMKS